MNIIRRITLKDIAATVSFVTLAAIVGFIFYSLHYYHVI